MNQLIDAPSWVNWSIVVGGAALSWVQPIAGVIAIIWGILQIYSWFRNKKWLKN